MSLFGSGRRESVFAVLALVGLTLAVHGLGVFAGFADGYEGDRTLTAAMTTAHRLVAAGELPLWDPTGAGAPLWARGAPLLYPPWWLLGQGQDGLRLPVLVAAHAALACALAFRFLRAQGRSRYASFLGGAAYGLGAHVGGLSGNLAEVAALAWAPLPIEILLHVTHSERRRFLAGLLGPALAIPFLTGGTVTAGCTATLVGFWLVRRTLHEPQRASLWLTALGSAVTACLLTAPLWLGAIDAPRAPAPPRPYLDLVPPLVRVADPLLVFLAVLGLFRRQRNAPGERWLPVAGAGAFVAALLPYVPSPFPGRAPWHESPAALWWPFHLALVLLAAGGLDDFLDLPVRRRAWTAAMLVVCTLVAPLGFLLGASDPTFHVEAALLLALAILFAGWRPLGILGFKSVLAAAALVWLSMATFDEQARAVRDPEPLPPLALPAANGAPPPAAPGLESVPPLATPPRARLSFQLCDASAAARLPRLQPLPAARPTAVQDLPAGFAAQPDPHAAVALVREGGTWSEYDVRMGQGIGALVVADTYAPGWQATIDGEPAPVRRADDVARAVLLHAGSHRVRFEYHPRAFLPGLHLAGAGLVLALLVSLAAVFWRSQSG